MDGLTRSDLMMSLTLDELPLAGGYATVHLCMENNGYAEMDVVVNRSNGQEPGDIFVSIFNEEGLEISRAYYQDFPAGAFTYKGTTL